MLVLLACLFSYFFYGFAIPTSLNSEQMVFKQLQELVPWIDPRINGGRFLDFTTPKYGEPLNVIISAASDPFILTDSGLHYYAKSIGFSEECLGVHIGQLHDADLGDGDGRKPEQFLARQYYFPIWGTCWESVIACRRESFQSVEAERITSQQRSLVHRCFEGSGLHQTSRHRSRRL